MIDLPQPPQLLSLRANCFPAGAGYLLCLALMDSLPDGADIINPHFNTSFRTRFFFRELSPVFGTAIAKPLCLANDRSGVVRQNAAASHRSVSQCMF
jgi:hypothetical protein